jgi:hypothetical protein
LDEEINAKKRIPALGFCLRGFSKKKISCVEKEDLFPFLFYLGDKRGFLGDTAKRVSKSPTGLDLTHHIIRIEDAELDLGFDLSQGGLEQREN